MPNCTASSGTDAFSVYTCTTCEAGADPATSNYTWNSTHKRCEFVD